MGDLYHYTSFGVLENIIKNKCLWFSDVEMTNDSSEFKYGLNKFEQEMQAFSGSYEDLLWNGLLKDAEKMRHLFRGSFIFCCSEYSLDSICCSSRECGRCAKCLARYNRVIKNGLLSQWRAYALKRNNDVGCCIIFDKDALEQVFKKILEEESFKDLVVGYNGLVNYDNSKTIGGEDLRGGITNLIAKIEKGACINKQEKIQNYFAGNYDKNFINELLKNYFGVALFNKDPNFDEEQEYRFSCVVAIKDPKFEGKDVEIKYENKDGIVKRRIEIEISPADIIKKIIVGPAKTKEIQKINKTNIKEMLVSYGLLNVEVSASEIPLI